MNTYTSDDSNVAGTTNEKPYIPKKLRENFDAVRNDEGEWVLIRKQTTSPQTDQKRQ